MRRRARCEPGGWTHTRPSSAPVGGRSAGRRGPGRAVYARSSRAVAGAGVRRAGSGRRAGAGRRVRRVGSGGQATGSRPEGGRQGGRRADRRPQHLGADEPPRGTQPDRSAGSAARRDRASRPVREHRTGADERDRGADGGRHLDLLRTGQPDRRDVRRGSGVPGSARAYTGRGRARGRAAGWSRLPAGGFGDGGAEAGGCGQVGAHGRGRGGRAFPYRSRGRALRPIAGRVEAGRSRGGRSHRRTSGGGDRTGVPARRPGGPAGSYGFPSR